MTLINDRKMEWKRKRETLWAVNSPGFSADTPVGLHTGAPVWAEVSDFGFAGFAIDAIGDEFVHYHPLPADVDVGNPIYMRVIYTTMDQDASDTADWIITYSDIAHGEVLKAGVTALDTVVPNDDASATSYNLLITGWGAIAASKLTEGDVLIIEVECNATQTDIAAAEDVWYLGIQIEYTPRKMFGTETLPEALAN